jgi:hypothetical protein
MGMSLTVAVVEGGNDMYSVHGSHAHIAHMSLTNTHLVIVLLQSSRLPVQYRPGNFDTHLSASNCNNIFVCSAVPWSKLDVTLE